MPPEKNVASHPSNLKLPNFEILFFELPNHFLHFNWLLGKPVPKLLVTYGIPYIQTEHCHGSEWYYVPISQQKKSWTYAPVATQGLGWGGCAMSSMTWHCAKWQHPPPPLLLSWMLGTCDTSVPFLFLHAFLLMVVQLELESWESRSSIEHTKTFSFHVGTAKDVLFVTLLL